jgi:RimJ/RimL family protein N-acetyltransferase
MRRYVAAALDLAERGLAVPFVTVDVRTNTLVGSTRFAALERWTWPEGSPEERAVGYADAAEIRWTWLSPRAQRTSINTEAKLLMLAHAFEQWELRRVWLKTDVRNTRSRDAIQRIGAQQEGILRNHSPSADGVLRDTVIFSVLPSDWTAIRDRLRSRLARG